jgi:hypothetical protein
VRDCARYEKRLQWAFGALLLWRLLLPFFASPLEHLYSDPARHWANGARFLNPDLMGAGDPYFYQLWIYVIRTLSSDSAPVVLLCSGLLCMAMPYGWYRAFRELLSRSQAFIGGIVMALVPGFFSIYGYFMNETLLLTLMGLAFWLTFRAWRKATVGAFALTSALWVCAIFTRPVVLPMAALCLGTLWIAQNKRLEKAVIGIVMLLMLAAPAGMHTKTKLGFFAPFGNTYLSEIYSHSGKKDIDLDAGPVGHWGFGSPSFYNPTFYPFSDWTTDRQGTVSIRIDVTRGRATWIEELKRIEGENTFGWTQRFKENLWYLIWGQSWPDNDPNSLGGLLNTWTRWLWLPLMFYVAYSVFRRRYRGIEWLLPASALGMLIMLALQTTGIIEGRYRKPIDPVLVAAAIVCYCRARTQHDPIAPKTLIQ